MSVAHPYRLSRIGLATLLAFVGGFGALSAGAVESGRESALVGLPQAVVLKARLDESPGVRAARAAVQAERETIRAEQGSSSAWTLSGLVGGRKYNDDPKDSPLEAELTLQRPWRSSAKLEARQAWFDQREAAARAQLRLASRLALREWLDLLSAWVREAGSARLWDEQHQLALKQAQAVSRRYELGDVSRSERDLVEAARVQIQVQVTLAQARARMARTRIDRQMPGWSDAELDALLQVEPQTASVPSLDPESAQAALEASVEYQAVQSESAVLDSAAQLEAVQGRSDPSFGLRLAMAKGYEEHGLGVVFSVPLDGEMHDAQSRAASHRAAQATARLQQERLRLLADRQAREIEVLASVQAWMQQTEAARRFDANARTAEKAWQLGQVALTDVITAQRLANEQRLAAQQARADALLRQWLMALDRQPDLLQP
jgi:outer membrane protein, heavy metal efflux system